VHQLDNKVYDITDARCNHENRRVINNKLQRVWKEVVVA